MFCRRTFLNGVASGLLTTTLGSRLTAADVAAINAPRTDEDVFAFIRRVTGQYDRNLYARILGAANEFKEGDEIIGVAAADAASRKNARAMLAETQLSDIDAYPVHRDDLFAFIEQGRRPTTAAEGWTLGRLRRFLLEAEESAIKAVMPSLSSDVIGCVVKLMTSSELIQVGSKVFNPLPGSRIGAKGYLGARIQPNSPTDNVDDIRWQVLDGWSYAVGDVLLGTNPVSSDPKSVAAIERTLQDLLTTFGIDDLMPHCVLSHIDIQKQVESRFPGSTELWFQSIGGTDSANKTFDISVEKMKRCAGDRTGRFGLYFETGQGADFTNGHGHGFDMVLHESRKYGFARALTEQIIDLRAAAGLSRQAWVHLNDVAGFIGPEVFRTREQLVRCCLEDIVMGKLHGLCIGLDVCSTLHMDISLDDLDWCLDQIMPACPAYLMALPTKIDPMLGYLTTGYQDHVRLREKFGCRVNDPIWQFFRKLNVVDEHGKPGASFGNPLALFLEYRKRKGDTRPDSEILAEGRREIDAVRGRGLFIAEGHGRRTWDLQPALKRDIHRIYDDAKLSIWAEFNEQFVQSVPDAVPLTTKSKDRMDYILHPVSGEQPDDESVRRLQQLRQRYDSEVDVQIVVSDGLNALAIMEEGQLQPFLNRVRSHLNNDGFRAAKETLVMTSGRVRAGYRAGETLFANLKGPRAILHVIGERPGTGHRTFSTYITAPDGDIWGRPGTVDHNITKVVSGIAITAFDPIKGADQVVRLLRTMMKSAA